MDISYIKEFVILAETMNYTAAAYQMHLSQSTLSRHIQTLEKELGHSLFHRSTRNIELSEYGQIYLPYAKQMAENAQKAVLAIQALEKQRNTKMMIGVVHHPDLFMATELIAGFRREHPEIPLRIYEGSLNELHQEFHAGRLRIITMSYPAWEKPQHGFVTAGTSQLVAVLPKNHPLAQLEKIPLKELTNIPLMVPEETNFPYRYLQFMFQKEQIQPDIVYQGNTSGIGNLLLDGMGILIQDKAIATAQLKDSLVIRRLEPDISYVFGLEYKKNLTRNEQIYVTYIKKQLKK